MSRDALLSLIFASLIFSGARAFGACRHTCTLNEVYDDKGCCVPKDTDSTVTPPPSGVKHPSDRPPGAACQTTTLGTQTVSKKAFVLAECLVIPDNTILTIPDGGELNVLATRRAQIGKNVRIVAVGGKGETGTPGVERKNWGAPHNDYKAAKDARCRPGKTSPGEENYDLVGKRGKPGHRGGNVQLILRQVDGAAGLSIDTSGGPGGDAGGSGHLRCYCNEHGNADSNIDGDTFDGDPAPSEGSGPAGMPGTIWVMAYGKQAPALEQAVSKAVAASKATNQLSRYVHFPPSKLASFRELEDGLVQQAGGTPIPHKSQAKK